MNTTDNRQTRACQRPYNEHAMREYVHDVWYPMPPMKFSSRKEQDKAEMRCLVKTGHQLHSAMEDGVGFVDKRYFCCECGMTLDLRPKSWWQRFLWDLRGRR